MLTSQSARLRGGWIHVAVVAGIASGASAQAATPGSSSNGEDLLASGDGPAQASGPIEVITVTARRREERVQDVPIPIAVLGGEALEGSGKFRLEELNQKLPSTNVQFTNPRQSSIAVRGLGNNPGNDALESSVGVYLDNVYLGRPGMANLDLIDIAQLSLLRGPQGTLFGKNTTAGVLAISTHEPTFTPEGRAEGSYGDYGGGDYYQIRAAYSGPLAYGWAGRVSVSKTARDGYIDDVANGRDVSSSDREGVRGQLLYKSGSDFSLRLIGDYNEENSQCCALILYSPGPNDGALFYSRVAAAGGTVVYDPDYRTTALDSRQYMGVRQGGGSAEADWQIGDYKLTSISAYRSWRFSPTNDGDYTSTPAILNLGQQVDDEQYSQELRIASPDGHTVEWVAGLFYFNQYQNNRQFIQYGPAAGVYLGAPALNNGLTTTRQRLKTESIAAFGQATWRLTDRLGLTGGVRQTFEDKSTHITRDVATGTPGIALAFPAYDSGDLELNDDNLAALLSVDYRIADDVLGYASVSRAAKSGGVNPQAPAAGFGVESLYIDAEEATDAELGVKSTLFEGGVVANLNLFWTRVRDYQATELAQSSPGVYVQLLSNVGLVRTRGVELEVSAAPLDGLSLTLAASYNDATYQSYPNAPCAAEALAAGQTSCDLSGQSVVGAPEWIVNPGVSYQRPIFGGLEGYGSLEYAWRSAFFGAPDNSQLARIDPYGLLNVRVGVGADVGDNHWDLSLWVNNATDERYVVGGLGQGSFRSYFLSPGAPRAFGATFRVEF